MSYSRSHRQKHWNAYVTCEQLLQGVIPEVCVLCGGVVEVQCVLLQPLASPPAAEQSHAEHRAPRLLAHRSPPFHLDCVHVLQQQHARLRHARLAYRETRVLAWAKNFDYH